MLRLLATLATCTTTCIVHAQVITFDRGYWQTTDRHKQKDLRVLRANEERWDTTYTEYLDGTGTFMDVSHTPFSRYEYDCESRLLRRIQIKQETLTDTITVEQLDGRLERIVQSRVQDIPDGDYFEYWPGRKVRFSGHLAGFDESGEPKKVGEWSEYDEAGALVSRTIFP